MDEGQFGFELVFHKSTLGITSLGDLTRAICEAAAAGPSASSAWRPSSVRATTSRWTGRKISGTGGFFDGDTIFYQGTVLVDMDPAKMLAALNVPQEKLAKRALDSAEARVVTLKELLGDAPPPGCGEAGACRGLRRAPRHRARMGRDHRGGGSAAPTGSTTRKSAPRNSCTSIDDAGGRRRRPSRPAYRRGRHGDGRMCGWKVRASTASAKC